MRPDGPIPAKVMIVGEAPGEEEIRIGLPFVGQSGNELNRMLGEAGISRGECFVTNVCNERPPNNDINYFIAKAKKDITHEHTLYRGKYITRALVDGCALLDKQVEMAKPNIIIALGNTALWSLTGLWGIIRWRGSMLYSDRARVKLIPTYHPAAVLRQWSWRATTVNDLRRAGRFRNGEPFPDPGWRFIIRPSYLDVISTISRLIERLESGPLRISFDLETRSGHIDCAGLAWSTTEALCIPFMYPSSVDGYWSAEEEGEIVYALYRLLTHRNAEVVGQNLLYDSQYTYRHWHFIPAVAQDSMISWHVCFPGLPKKLDYQASMLCDQYCQWKKERGAWKEGG